MNLLDAEVTEVVLVIGADGRARTFYPNDETMDTQQIERLAGAIVRAGLWFAESHGLTVQRIGPFTREGDPHGPQ